MKDLIRSSPRVHARVSGLVGLIVLISGTLSGTLISRLVDPKDPVATASRIVESESLFRIGIVAGLAMMIAYLFYGLLLHRLLRPVSPGNADAMLALVLISVPIYMLNQTNQVALLKLAKDGANEQIGLFIEIARFGTLVSAIFFGLWLFPLGWLVFRSGFLPKAIGVLLMVGSLGYLILFVQAFFYPGSERTLWSNPFLVVTHLSELALLLWLMIRGVDDGRWEQSATGGE